MKHDGDGGGLPFIGSWALGIGLMQYLSLGSVAVKSVLYCEPSGGDENRVRHICGPEEKEKRLSE